MNAETNRLKERLLSIKNTNSNNSVERIKKEQISEIYKKYLKEEINNYEKKVFNGSIIDVEKIEIKLEFVENQSQERLFEYYRNVVSSVPQYNIPGRQLKILVKDNNSDSYLGLIQLTVDLLVNDKKNIFLGVEEKDYGKYKKVIRDCGVNISICVPLQPFGFNYCGGKLLAMLAFSKEVYNYYLLKYNTRIAYIMTTSINGKSVQYSKLKCLKFIGLTAGFGTCHISEDIINECKEFVRQNFPKYKIKKMSKHTILNLVISTLKLPEDILQHNKQRGIYIGLTSSDSCLMIKEKMKKKDWYPDLLQDIGIIFNEWYHKHAKKRNNNLKKDNK
jgi:hypothetical protein